MKNLSVILFATTMLLGLAACSKSTKESSPDQVITYTASEKVPGVTNLGESGFYVYAFNTKIANHSFSDGQGTITFEGAVTNIGIWAFRFTSITSITLPDSVTSIDDYAFGWCTSLSSVTLPNSLISIGEAAFHDCRSLESVTIPNSVISLENSAFSDCRSLSSVTFGNSVICIGNFAFGWCTSLTSITLPDSVTNIGCYAFAYCSSLKSVTLPNSVDCIGENAFYDCPNDLIVRVPQESYDRFRRMIDSDVTVVGY